jgi:hypothetical protein
MLRRLLEGLLNRAIEAERGGLEVLDQLVPVGHDLFLTKTVARHPLIPPTSS